MIFDAAAKKVHISVEELCHTVVNHASIDTRGARLYPDKGTVAEVGSHDELMRKKGIYYGLVMAQRQMSKMAPKNGGKAEKVS